MLLSGGPALRKDSTTRKGAYVFGVILNNAIVRACTRLLRYLPGLQPDERKHLVHDVQVICNRSAEAYSALLARLLVIKAAFRDPVLLVRELRLFSADTQTRAAFKPEYLCGEVDQLLQELKGRLDTLGYSVRMSGLGTLDETLRRMADYEGELSHQYDQFRSELDHVAAEVERTTGPDRRHWVRYVEELVSDTEVELHRSIGDMHRAKEDVGRVAF